MINVNIKDSFIDLNSIICTNVLIQDLYKVYSKEIADKIMWAIFMIEYPDKDINEYADVPRLERIKDVQTGYFEINMEDETVLAAIKGFHKFCLSFEENMFRIQKKSIDEMMELQDRLNLENDVEFAKSLKIAEKLDKLWKNYELARTRLSKAKDVRSKVYGDVSLSGSAARNKRRKK